MKHYFYVIPHIKPKVQSQRHFDKNLECGLIRVLQSRIIFSRKNCIQHVRPATTPQEVFWKCILAEGCNWCGYQCERAHWIIQKEMLYSVHPFSLCFLHRSHQNVEIRSSVWKQSKVYQSVVAAKRISWIWIKLPSGCDVGNVKGV